MSRRLTKSRTNIVFTGTLGGIAEYMGIDPTILRLIYAVISFFSACFPGLFLYIILSCIIPSGKGNQGNGNGNPYANNNSRGFYGNPYKNNSQQNRRKEAEKIDEDDWSDF